MSLLYKSPEETAGCANMIVPHFWTNICTNGTDSKAAVHECYFKLVLLHRLFSSCAEILQDVLVSKCNLVYGPHYNNIT